MGLRSSHNPLQRRNRENWTQGQGSCLKVTVMEKEARCWNRLGQDHDQIPEGIHSAIQSWCANGGPVCRGTWVTDVSSWWQQGEHWLLSQNQCGMQIWDPPAFKSRGHFCPTISFRCSLAEHREGRKGCNVTDWAFYIMDNFMRSLKYWNRLGLPDWIISITPPPPGLVTGRWHEAGGFGVLVMFYFLIWVFTT